jgi:tetratricopeptide (TPR) repeat protein
VAFGGKARFRWVLGGMLLAAIVVRLGYVAAQAGSDPWFLKPMGGDPRDNLFWAWEIASGEGLRGGAFYGAPLYPYLLSGFLRLFGENFGLLYYLQHLSMVAAAGLLASTGRRLMGEAAGLAAGAVFLLYQPNLFFASRPMAEPIGILLMSLAVFAVTGRTRRAGAVAGWVAGLASVARPSLLPVAPLWAMGVARRSPWRAAALVLGFVLALVPTTVRNYLVSGHVVPVSSNAGVTFYHGNGPAATGYIRVPPELGQVGKGNQRKIATRVASERAGRVLDDVEADRWWGRQALRERLRHPLGSARLLLWRVALLGWNAELALDMGPRQDPNPLRWAAPLPFAAILGLTAAGIALAGWRGTGGWAVWGAVLACAVAPLAFYVCSRYRLPLVAMLCLPAGAGLAALVRPRLSKRARWRGFAVAVVVATLSLAVPAGDLLAQSDAGGFRQRAWAWRQVLRFPEAEADVRRSLELQPGSPHAWFQLGDVLELTGRAAEAEACFRQALHLQPGYARASCALGSVLRDDGRAAEAVQHLRRGLEVQTFFGHCRSDLVGALATLGRLDEARAEVDRAAAAGETLDPGVLVELRRLADEADAHGGDNRR